MASPNQGKPKRVTVIHFPKVGKVPPRRPTVSITELKVGRGDDDVTDPHVVVTPEPKGATKGAPSKAPSKSGPKKTKTADTPAVHPESHMGALKGVETPQEAADLAAFGHRLFEMGKLDEARAIFEKLVAADPGDGFVHTMLGTVYLALNAQERALAMFQTALKIDPDDLAAVVYRGEIRLNRGKVKGALDDLQRAVTLAPAGDPFVERAKRLIRMAKGLAKRKK